MNGDEGLLTATFTQREFLEAVTAEKKKNIDLPGSSLCSNKMKSETYGTGKTKEPGTVWQLLILESECGLKTILLWTTMILCNGEL